MRIEGFRWNDFRSSRYSAGGWIGVNYKRYGWVLAQSHGEVLTPGGYPKRPKRCS